jgi:hypothetical protein
MPYGLVVVTGAEVVVAPAARAVESARIALSDIPPIVFVVVAPAAPAPAPVAAALSALAPLSPHALSAASATTAASALMVLVFMSIPLCSRSVIAPGRH